MLESIQKFIFHEGHKGSKAIKYLILSDFNLGY